MNIELCTDLLARDILDILDPMRTGAFVEIGLGTRDFSFTWAAPLGFRCHAVEPLPTETLIRACHLHNTSLTVAAVTDHLGEVPIYLGDLAGRSLTDISSLNPRWWGCKQESRVVPALTLSRLFSDRQIASVTFLKVDTEGSEQRVMGDLVNLPETQRPAMIAFEYGGGGCKKEKQGGWADEFLYGTLNCLDLARRMGYRQGLMIEQSRMEVVEFDLRQGRSFVELFPEQATVGNFMILRELLEPSVLPGLLKRTAVPLAKDARCTAARLRGDWLNHHRIRILRGIARRLPW